jgi:putative ABC transport system permease protein
MTRRSRFGTVGLLLRHLGSDPLPSVLVAALIAAVVLIVALAPRALSAVSTAELRHRLDAVLPVALDFRGDVLLQPFRDDDAGGDLFGDVERGVAGLADQPRPFADILGAPGWFVLMDSEPATNPDAGPRVPRGLVSLAIDPIWESRVRFVDGAAPKPWAGSDDPRAGGERPPIEVAISADAAELLSASVGDVFDYGPAPLQIAGVYRPTDAEDPYWQHAFTLGTARLTSATETSPEQVVAAAYVATESAPSLRDTLQFATLSVFMPVDPDRLDYADAALVATQARASLGAGTTLASGENVRLVSRLPDVVDEVRERVTALTSLLALSASGPLGVAFAVFGLGARSVIDRRRATLALAGARGASGTQVRGAMLLEGVLLAAPGAALALGAAALLLPSRVGAEAIVLPLAVAVAVPLLFAGTASPKALRATRSDLTVRSRSGVRWVLEAAVVGLAALSVFLLLRRGLIESSAAVGVDPLLVAAPLLLAAAACIAVLRVYPIPLLALQRILQRGRGAVGPLGAASAVRDPAFGFAAALALVVGVAVAVFSSVMTTTVATALATTAREEVGADIRVSAYDLGEDVVAAAAAVPGVVDLTAVGIAERVIIGDQINGSQVTVVFADTATLRVLQPSIPAALDEAVDGVIPFVASSRIEDREIDEPTRLNGVDAAVVARAPQDALPGIDRPWLLVDASFVPDLIPAGISTSYLLADVDPDADVAEVADAVADAVIATQRDIFQDDVEVMDAATQLAAARAAPLASGLERALLLALLISAGLCVVTVLLASVSAAAHRNRTVGVLRTLGMSTRQSGGLAAWETGPVALTAAVAGLGLGIALPWIVTATLDLRPFVGGIDAPRPNADPALVAIVVVGFLVVAAVAAIVATAIGRRIHPAGIVKMGAE